MYSILTTHQQKYKERFNTLFKQHYNNVVYYACSYLRDKSIAEEIAQDVFSMVWENIDKIEDNAFPYIIVVTKNRCINFLKKKNKGKYIKNI
jgi:DNA-directed RNA polymerase specialized sigma subunit, sigma24 homolog